MAKLLLIVIVALAALGGSAAASDPLSSYRWVSRVLVVVAPDAADSRLEAQRRALAAARDGLAERDLVTIEVVGREPKAAAFRQRLQVPENAFRAVLIGKDGGPKLTSDAPIPPQKLFATIDAMPMRQQEMRR